MIRFKRIRCSGLPRIDPNILLALGRNREGIAVLDPSIVRTITYLTPSSRNSAQDEFPVRPIRGSAPLMSIRQGEGRIFAIRCVPKNINVISVTISMIKHLYFAQIGSLAALERKQPLSALWIDRQSKCPAHFTGRLSVRYHPFDFLCQIRFRLGFAKR
jgi:hypothetical protein